MLYLSFFLYVLTYFISYFLSGDLGWELTTIIKDVIIGLFLLSFLDRRFFFKTFKEVVIIIFCILVIIESVWNVTLFLNKEQNEEDFCVGSANSFTLKEKPILNK